MNSPVHALLIIDPQRGLLEGEAAVPNAHAFLDRLVELLTKARKAGALVLFFQNDGQPGAIDEPESAGWHLHPRVTPKPAEIILRKSLDDAFENSELEAILADNQISRIAVAGLLSEMCVSATVRGALVRGFEVALVRDVHATYDLEDIPSATVSRVAEHALGDEVELIESKSITFHQPPGMGFLA